MLKDHHRLSSRFRTVLWAGAMLHDIGTDERLAELPGEHGWRSADFIRQSPERFGCNLANSDEIAVLAALHSGDEAGDESGLGEVPDWLAETFGELPKELRWLVAILRVADGLDRGLDQTVAEVTALDLANHRILVRADSADVGVNIDRANQKAGLLRRVLGCPQLRIEGEQHCGGVPGATGEPWVIFSNSSACEEGKYAL
jgi:exopolyphosphatase/pppGpp-phosphohydrolase